MPATTSSPPCWLCSPRSFAPASRAANADLIALLIVATLGACVLKWFEQPDPKTLDRTIELTTTVLLTGLTHSSS